MGARFLFRRGLSLDFLELSDQTGTREIQRSLALPVGDRQVRSARHQQLCLFYAVLLASEMQRRVTIRVSLI